MCGFVAFLSLGNVDLQTTHRVVQGARLIEHRGPDDEAFYFSPEYCAGFRRLSIIDLSDAGRQPMADPSKRFWIVFNGEIYNYKEIRSELIGLGHQFKTSSDTEVLLASYVQWGQDCLPKLNGMFAFMIWDSHTKTLFGARDRFGEKPLFYSKTKNGFAWASEIKGLVPLLDFPVQPNDQILSDYLVEGKIDHSNDTFYQGIHSLPASHQFTIRNGNLQISQYWSLESSEVSFTGSAEDAVEQFKSLFEDSIRLRMRSDVPIGTCLSGGMDSSSIVCTIAKMLGSENFNSATRKTFTAHYPEFDETQQLDDVVRQAQCESFRISPKPDSLDNLRDLLWYQDEPFMSFSVFASREVMRKAHEENVKVLINGQGADEVLAGYSKFLKAYLSDLIRVGRFLDVLKIVKSEKDFTTRGPLQSIGVLLREEARSFGSSMKMLGSVKVDRKKPVACDWILADFLTNVSRPRFRDCMHGSEKTGKLKTWLKKSMFVDYLPLYLRVEDRNAMSFSLESRLPFLDPRIPEFVMSLPTHLLMKNGRNKWLLREAMRGTLPSSVLDRRTKFGFPAPDAGWQTGFLSEQIKDLVNSKSLKERGVFNVLNVKKLLDRIPLGLTGDPREYVLDSRRIFRIVCGEMWLRELPRYESLRYSAPAIPTPISIVNQAG